MGKDKLLSGHRRRLASLQLVKQGKEAYRKMPCMVEDAGWEQGPEADELRAIDEAILLITTQRFPQALHFVDGWPALHSSCPVQRYQLLPLIHGGQFVGHGDIDFPLFQPRLKRR